VNAFYSLRLAKPEGRPIRVAVVTRSKSSDGSEQLTRVVKEAVAHHSTPHSLITDKSAIVALVNGNTWDLHRPLTEE
jgi:hypothetical protein